GYARISTTDQNLDFQLDALNSAGCKRIFKDTVSGAKKYRPGLDELLENLREGDVVLVWKLDRLGRNLKHLVELVTDFNERGIGLKSLNDPIDTTSAQGRLVFNIFASLAEFEREVIRERTRAGLEAARKRGRKGGRPRGLSQKAKQKAIVAEALYREDLSVNEICEQLKIAKATFYSYLRYRGVEVKAYKKGAKQGVSEN
ncbi:recombinase family protein, partial [Xanthovirga aplysinae]|uniref:recombinase family protein n=1 Tax=Xanthovirga aplysinae TaxID=2529853 RepID=UPI0012BCD3D6